jgi:hypothetical protein
MMTLSSTAERLWGLPALLSRSAEVSVVAAEVV